MNIVTHTNCTKADLCNLVYRYNNHTSMNSNQKGFIMIPEFARVIREIKDGTDVFQDYICSNFTTTSQIKGVVERLIIESVCLVYHPECWGEFKKMCASLNEVASAEDFENIKELWIAAGELFQTSEIYKMFGAKNGAFYINLYNQFRELNIDDKYFVGFMENFDDTELDEMLNKTSQHENKTKKKTLIKIDYLHDALVNYIKELEIVSDERLEDKPESSALDFVKANVTDKVNDEDIELFEETLELLTLEVDNNSKLLDIGNHNPLIGVIAYSYEKDLELDDWFIKYFDEHDSYNPCSENSYEDMRVDLVKFNKGIVA